MTLRFISLGSGSRGNASLVEFGSTWLMVDCGLPCKIVEERLQAVDRQPRDVTAILVTHEHTDHAQGVATFSKLSAALSSSSIGSRASSPSRSSNFRRPSSAPDNISSRKR